MGNLYGLTEQDVAILRRMVQAYRQDRLDLVPNARDDTTVQSRYGPLWQVTAVDTEAETCEVQRVDSEDTLDESSEQTGILYDTDNVPSVGHNGMLTRYNDGNRFFFRKGMVVYKPNNSRAVDEVGAVSTVRWQEEYNGSWSTTIDGFVVWKFDTPLAVLAAQVLRANVVTSDAGANTWQLRYHRAAGTINALAMICYFSVIKEDFTLATLDRAGLMALSRDDAIIRPSARVDVQGGNEVGQHLYATDTHSKKMGIGMQTDGPITCYGFALWLAGTWNVFEGTPGNGDIRSCRFYVGPAYDINCVVAPNTPVGR